ncbi:MAG: alpha/beta hydrolase [Firmicutes bacterium]|nr:alpha/beta hydrolase [Bacillota bacterium]
MNLNKIKIEGIPVIIWGERSDKTIIAAHGSHSSKIDDCMWILADEAIKQGYQILSFDLPQHGERVYETDLIMPDECVRELMVMYDYAKEQTQKISLFGCSMGAYFQLLTFADIDIDRVWFLSPVTDMERIIHNLMNYCHITEEQFKKKVIVENDIETLYFPYYEYVCKHPITNWPHETYILRGEMDTLSEYSYVKRFSDCFGCELIEQKGGEHWFHTESELDFFRHWIRNRL